MTDKEQAVSAGSCPSCNGTGDLGGNPSYGVCPDCDGTGKFPAIPAPEGVGAVVRHGYHVSGVMEPLADGEWVKLSAHLTEVSRLNAEVERLRGELDRLDRFSAAAVASVDVDFDLMSRRAETAEASLANAVTVIEQYADPSGYFHGDGDPYEPSENHPGMLAADFIAKLAVKS